MSLYKPFVYSDAWSDAYYARQSGPGRIFLAIMLDDEPIGAAMLKNIDPEKNHAR